MRDIESDLVQLGTTIVVPEPLSPAAVASAVTARLTEPGSAPAPEPDRSAVAKPRRRGLLVAATVATLLAGLTLSPAVRAAAGDLLRFAGVEVTWGQPDAPLTPESSLPSAVVTDLASARRAADFTVGVPAVLGDPVRVLVADGGRVVSLLYDPGAAPIRLDEFDGTLEPVFVKQATDVLLVPVAAGEGLWFDEPHDVVYVTGEGEIFEESARLTGQTLMWQTDAGVTLRLEGDLTLAEAQAIADSIG